MNMERNMTMNQSRWQGFWRGSSQMMSRRMGFGYMMGFMGSQYWMFSNSMKENERQSQAIQRREENDGGNDKTQDKLRGGGQTDILRHCYINTAS